MMDFVKWDALRRTIFYPKTDVAEQAASCSMLHLTRKNDLAMYRSAVEALCKHRWSDRLVHIDPVNHAGTYHLIYRIEKISGPSYIVRLNRFKDNHVSWEFLIDGWVYPQLALCGLPSPIFVDADFSRTVCPTDYELLTYVSGSTLNSFEDPETQYMHPGLLQAIGQYVALVHSIKLAGGYGPLSAQSLQQGMAPQGIHTSWRDYILLRLGQHCAVCQSIGSITDKEKDEIDRLFVAHEKLFENIPCSLLHGDLGNHNFISKDGHSISALIDWEDCMSGDPMFDIAFWGTFFRDYMRTDFLNGYTRVKALSADFELRYWLYYLRIALSKTVHRHYFGYTDRQGRPPASRRIQKALEHLKNF